MKYFIDTHDKTKGSFPVGELTEQQFLAQFDELEKVAPQFDAFAHAAHVNLKEGKAFCFMCGPEAPSRTQRMRCPAKPNRPNPTSHKKL